MLGNREADPLTRLNAQRQSGGERAVSTIFYLMALQSLTRSPFRVVDEINQGMDPRNERLVHARMVAIATGNDEWSPDVDLIAPRDTRNGHVDSDGDEDDEDDIRPSRNGTSNGVKGTQVDGEVNGKIERVDLSSSQGSQYFLVTPKLLHDLRYEEGMTILCIVSGEHLLEQGKSIEEISFKKGLEIRRKAKGQMVNGNRAGAVGAAA